jgi:hypothetical protein
MQYTSLPLKNLTKTKKYTHKISIRCVDIHYSASQWVVLGDGHSIGARVEDGRIWIAVDIDGGCCCGLDVGIHCIVGDESDKVRVGQETIQGHGSLQGNHTGQRIDIKEGGSWVVARHLVADFSLKERNKLKYYLVSNFSMIERVILFSTYEIVYNEIISYSQIKEFFLTIEHQIVFFPHLQNLVCQNIHPNY